MPAAAGDAVGAGGMLLLLLLKPHAARAAHAAMTGTSPTVKRKRIPGLYRRAVGLSRRGPARRGVKVSVKYIDAGFVAVRRRRRLRRACARPRHATRCRSSGPRPGALAPAALALRRPSL